MSFQSRLPVLADEATKSLVLYSDDPFELRGLIPKSRTIDHPEWNFACLWDDQSAQLLRNMGFEAPFRSTKWPGKYQPLPHQLEMIDFILDHKRCFNLSEMGTMKTAAALWAADKLMKRGELKKVLILAPLSSLERTWQQDIFDVLMHRVCAVVHGTREQREFALNSPADFYILNHD